MLWLMLGTAWSLWTSTGLGVGHAEHFTPRYIALPQHGQQLPQFAAHCLGCCQLSTTFRQGLGSAPCNKQAPGALAPAKLLELICPSVQPALREASC